MAAGLDGDINIGLNMNTKSAEQSLSSFRKKLRDGFSATDTKSLDQSIKQTKKTIRQLETSIGKTKQKLQELSQSSTPPKSVIAMEKELAQLEKQLAKVDSDFSNLSKEQADLASRQVPGLTLEQSLSTEQYARFQELDALIIKNGEDTDKLNSRIAELKTKLAEVKANPKLTEEGKKYTAEITNSNIKLREQQQIYDRLKDKQTALNNKAKEQSSIQSRNNSISMKSIPIIGGVERTLSRILKLAKRVFIFSLITSGLRSLRTGLLNIISVDNQLSSSLAQIKGNLLTAFAPIYNACLPALRSLMSALSTATAYVASFISMLFGKSVKSSKTAAKSLYSVASAADTAGSSAKKAGNNAKKAGKDAKKAGKDAEKSLYAFDELNQLDSSASDKDDKDDNDSGSGGGSGGGISPDFNSVIPDTSIWNKFISIITKIKDIFMSGFWKGFESADFTPIITSLQSIKQSLKDIFLSTDTVQSAETLVKSLIFTLGEITGSVASIGVTIVSNLLQAMASYLSDNKDYIKKSIINIFDITTEITKIVGDWWVALANIFSVLADTNGVRLTAAFLGIFNNAALGITELALKIGRDFITYLCQPIINNQEPLKQTIDSLLGIFASLSEGIKSFTDNIVISLNKLYDNSISPFIKDVTNIVSALMSKILNAYNTYLAPTLQSIGKEFKELIDVTINPLINKFLLLLGKIVTLISEIVSTVYSILSPVIDWLLTSIGTNLSGVLNTFWKLIKTIITNISNLLNIILDVLIGISDFLINVFQGNWTGAWKSIQSTFKTLVADFVKFGKDIITGLLNGLKTIGNSIKQWAKSSIIEPFKKLFGIHSPSTVFKDFGINLIQGLMNGIDSLKDTVINWFKDRWSDIQNVFSTVNTWFGNKFSEAWSAITNAFSNAKSWFTDRSDDIQNAFSTINTWFGNKFISAWDAITNAFSNVKSWFSGKFDDIQNIFANIGESFKGWFSSAWSAIKLVFSDWGTFFQNLWGVIKSTFTDLGVKLGSAMGNAIRTGINKVITWIQKTINSAINLINGAITLINAIPGVSVGYIHTITLPTIPALANGAVLPPNQPFLAMVGDQKRGTNIEAPLSTIQEALANELDKRQSYNNYSENITLQLALDERVFGQVVIEAAELEKARKGNSFVKTNISFA